MERQLQGIAFILVGILLMLAIIAIPWEHFGENILVDIMAFLALLFGMVGLSGALKNGKK